MKQKSKKARVHKADINFYQKETKALKDELDEMKRKMDVIVKALLSGKFG